MAENVALLPKVIFLNVYLIISIRNSFHFRVFQHKGIIEKSGPPPPPPSSHCCAFCCRRRKSFFQFCREKSTEFSCYNTKYCEVRSAMSNKCMCAYVRSRRHHNKSTVCRVVFHRGVCACAWVCVFCISHMLICHKDVKLCVDNLTHMRLRFLL